jgi:hypothetical protein
VHSFMGAVLLRLAGQDPLMLNTEVHPPHIELGEPVEAVVAKGTPLSVRMARGRPYSRNSRSKTGRTPWPLVDSRP